MRLMEYFVLAALVCACTGSEGARAQSAPAAKATSAAWEQAPAE
jgi:hypothetical protein